VELRLVVQAPSGARSDVLVDVEPDTSASELIAELCRYLELSPAEVTSARLERSDSTLGGDIPVRRTGLRDGDLLVLGNGAAAPSQARAEETALYDLVVVGGPDAGVRHALPGGQHVVGRGPGADLVLSDRSMSRRHLWVEVGPSGVTVGDAGSSNGTFLAGAPVAGKRALKAGEVVEAGRSLIGFEPHAAHAAVEDDGAGRVSFNRPPRVARARGHAEVQLPPPPADTPGGKLPIGAAAIPLLLGGVMFAVTGSPYSLMFALLSPAMAMYAYLEGRGSDRRARREALSTWRAELDEAEVELTAARAAESGERRAAAPDAASLRARAGALDPRLWERRPGDDDFLALRLGTADLEADAQPRLAPGGAAALTEEATERLEPGARLTNVPVVVPLAAGALGIAGPPGAAGALARWLIAQAAVLHSPRELEVAVAVDPRLAAEWAWVKWLPHARGEGAVTGAAEAAAMLARPPAAGSRLVIVDGDLGLPPNALEQALAQGTSAVWLAREARAVPGACTAIAELDADVAALRLVDVRSGAVVEDAAAEGVAPEWAEELARMLAPVLDAGAPDDAASLPGRVSLLELLGLPEPTPTAMAARWRAGEDGLSAPIGVAAHGRFEIDAGQVEGLRMLLAGMPGTGKSELLQTLIGALAASHSPARLAFLLVDYKGGAAFGDCARLPHTVGMVTDLDARLADRARTALLAELRRREGLLSEHGAKSLRELARRRPDAPPALVIVVDEFATLVREVPAFLDTLVDVAQRGRSLGLHLVLATQRPRGAVSDALRANTNLRMAMRVSDEGESRDVIEAPDAAAIPAGLPGRAIALTGRAPDGAPRLVELQAAYSGGRTVGVTDRNGIRVRALGRSEQDQELERVLSTIGGTRPTDLQVLVACARATAEREGIPEPRPPWLPALPERLELEDLAAGTAARPVLGLVDDPDAQAQPGFALDLERDGGMIVYGASGSGRTAALRTLACSLAAGSSPKEVQIYGLDFASRALGELEQLPHVGSIVSADDEERALRLLSALRRAVDARRARVAGGGRPGEPGFPRVVLLVDGYAGFTAAFERTRLGEPVQTLTRLAADGRPLGLHVVVTADRRADVPGALSGVLGERIVLRLASDDEYTALGVPRAALAGATLPPGRGFARDARELQLAWVAPEAIAEIAHAAEAAHPGERAPAVGRLPGRVDCARLPTPGKPLEAVIGIDGDRLEPLSVSLAQQHLLVAGAHHSGLSTALAAVAVSLHAGTPQPALHLLAPRRTPLLGLDNVWTSVAEGVDACADLAERLAAGDEPLVVFLDDGLELAEGACAAPLEELLRRGRDAQLRLVAAVDAHGVQRVYGGWLRDLRANRTGLLLQPTTETADVLGVRLPPAAGPMPPGRGFLVDRGAAQLIQVASVGLVPE
jgi:S-DNA-T family DNA segregation ATPase FtsK/SpoIIIE